jgi:multidrug resistance efflux pump
MEPLTVIPTPPSQRWREFRIRYVPPLVFLSVACLIGLIWRQEIVPPLLVGQVQPIRAEVISPDDGVITNLYVSEFQEVRAGDIVAEVISTDTRRIAAELQLLNSQMSASQLQFGALSDKERLVLAYSTLKLRYLREQTDLETAKAELEPAERDYVLNKQLFDQKLISEPELDFYARTYRPLKAKVEQITLLLANVEKDLQGLKKVSSEGMDVAASSARDKILLDLEQEHKQLQTLQSEHVVLRAPIDGVVQAIHRRRGENVLAGTSVVTIASAQSERIIGYMRQPFPFRPKEGMKVRIRTREMKRQEAEGVIASVGGQFETITNSVLVRPGVPSEIGLPIAISIPAAIKTSVRPGELVELSIRH